MDNYEFQQGLKEMNSLILIKLKGALFHKRINKAWKIRHEPELITQSANQTGIIATDSQIICTNGRQFQAS